MGAKYAFLWKVHAILAPKRYLEIGVRKGRSLSCALSSTRAVGIDPSPEIAFPVSHRTTIETMTSEEYFQGTTETDGSDCYDLVLIDGLHLSEQVMYDFIASEKHSCTQSVILIDDVLPPDKASASRERGDTRNWAGDVWKVVPILAEFRPELNVRTIAIPPAGMAVVEGVDPGSSALEAQWEQILSFASGLDYDMELEEVRRRLARPEEVLRGWEPGRTWGRRLVCAMGRAGRWSRLMTWRLLRKTQSLRV